MPREIVIVRVNLVSIFGDVGLLFNLIDDVVVVVIDHFIFNKGSQHQQ